MDLQDPKVQRILISALISVAVLYVYFGTSLMGFTYPSRRAEITQLNEEYEKLSRELERARLTVGNMAKLEREFEYLHRQWNVAKTLLPEDNEMSELLRKVTAAGTQAGLEFVRFEPKPSLAHGFYSENPIEVEVEGGYHQVGSFLSQLANLNRIINVRNLSLVGVKPEDQGKPEVTHSVGASMEVVTYSVDKTGALPSDASTGSQQLAQGPGANPNTVSHVRDKLTASRQQAGVGGTH
jgi:type IV pilus assembly protein PilO